MVEHNVASYIATELGMTLGTDIFANALPENVDYGVYVRTLDETFAYDKLTESVIGVFITYDSYYTTREKALAIKDALVSMKGLGDWTSGGEATLTNLGTNAAGDEMMVVTASIFNGG